MKKGLYLVLITVLISGFANFINKLALNNIGHDPYQYTTLKNIFSALVVCLFVLSPLVFKKLKRIRKNDWLTMILLGLLGGSIPFLLYFKGLSMTSAISASFLHKTLFIWVALLAWPFLKEKIGRIQFLALGVLFLGNIVFVGFRGLSWGWGETFIIIATLFWAVENIIVKRVLSRLDPMILAWSRMFFGSGFLLLFLVFSGKASGLFAMSQNGFAWLILVAGFLAAYIVSWYGALQKLPVSVAASFLVLASPLTTLISSVYYHRPIMLDGIIGLVIMAVGILLFYVSYKRNEYKREAINA